VPLLVEAFRTSGAAAVLDASVVIKRRQRGLAPSQLVEGLFALWAAGGERCDDLVQWREDAALALLLGHGLPAPQTARDFLAAFDEALPPLWQGERCHVQGEGPRLSIPPRRPRPRADRAHWLVQGGADQEPWGLCHPRSAHGA
jgi:hypothetical protein